MSGPEFFQTMMGKRYYESTLPAHTKAMNRLASAIEEQNKLEKEKGESSWRTAEKMVDTPIANYKEDT